jgi:hypothetical protein
MRLRSVVLAAGCCVVCLFVGNSISAPSSAAQTQARSLDCGITSPIVVAGRSVFPQLAKLGASFLVYAVRWADVAKTKPANGRDPEDTAYDWAALDTAFAQAGASGIEIVPEIYATPAWANGNRAPEYGPTKPSDYADFIVAMGTRYPQIRRWIIWGEPSRPQQWQPQGRAGARRYAQLLDTAYAAIKRLRKADIVIGGNTQPNGPDTVNGTSPKSWLKWLVLPNGHRPRFDQWGHNPFTERPIDLRLNPASRFTYDFDDLDTLARELDTYYPGRHIRLFLSESGIPTEHGNVDWFFHTTRVEQAHRLSQMYDTARTFTRIAAISNFLLRDESGSHGWTTGLVTHTGVKKPAWGAYQSRCRR